MLGKREGKGIHVQGVLGVRKNMKVASRRWGQKRGFYTSLGQEEDGHCCLALNLLETAGSLMPSWRPQEKGWVWPSWER